MRFDPLDVIVHAFFWAGRVARIHVAGLHLADFGFGGQARHLGGDACTPRWFVQIVIEAVI